MLRKQRKLGGWKIRKNIPKGCSTTCGTIDDPAVAAKQGCRKG
jgi:hypothetical protein